MMYEATPKEHKEHKRRLIKFCKDEDNHCFMYNYMLTIEEIRKEGEESNFIQNCKKNLSSFWIDADGNLNYRQKVIGKVSSS